MIGHINDDNNTVSLPTGCRDEICKTLNITTCQISNALKELKELHIITGEKGSFTLNDVYGEKIWIEKAED